jgi:GntR family transcriptional regulator
MKKTLLADMSVDFASPVPVYEQIKRKIKHAIARKSLLEDEPLPSIRELASFLKINPNTVARAYRELVQEKIVGGRAGKGFWVEKTGDLEQAKVSLLKEEFLKFLERAIEMGFSQERLKEMILGFFKEEL